MTRARFRLPGAPRPPNPVRVGLLIDGSEGGGVGHSLRFLIQRLDRRQVYVIGVFMGCGMARDRLAPHCDEVIDLDAGCLLPLTAPGHNRYYLPNLFVKARSFITGMLRLVGAIRRARIDVLHANFYPIHLLGALASRLSCTPCIWHWRGATDRSTVEQAVFEGGLQLGAASVACISRFVAESLPPEGRRRACVVYNGVPVRRIQTQQRKGELRQRLGLDGRVPLVGLVGSFTRYKGHECFLHAAKCVLKHMPNVQFVLVGWESPQQRARLRREEALRRLVADLGIASQVHFAGRIDDIALLIGDLDVSCVPTMAIGIRGEGFGLVMAEGMAAGVATVASALGGPCEVIEDGHSGLLFPAGDEQALADAVLRLLGDDTFRERIARAGQRRIETRFDIDCTAQSMEQVYLACATGQPPRGRDGEIPVIEPMEMSARAPAPGDGARSGQEDPAW